MKPIKETSILVIGDVMLDRYITGQVTRISPEAPVPVLLQQGSRDSLGGAANVAANLIAAGQKVTVLTVIGQDQAGARLEQLMQAAGIDTTLLFPDIRPTTCKTRFLAREHQQILRLDQEDPRPISSEQEARILTQLAKQIHRFRLVVLSDYAKGLLTPSLTQQVIQMAKAAGLPVLVDGKGSDGSKYRGADLLKPNESELKQLTGKDVDRTEDLIQAAQQLGRALEIPYILTTRGPKGMVLVSGGEPYVLSSSPVEVFDVTGAGDTALAYLAACLASDLDIHRAVEIANRAAGIQVMKSGTATVSWQEVWTEGRTKELPVSALRAFRQENREKTIVFTNGCFDILHVGHLHCLQEAAKLGHILVVGLNSDASVTRLKGPTRPVNCQKDRAEMLQALPFVDYVTVFEADTPYDLIQTLQPDVLVKGGDYSPQEVVGADLVEKLVLIPLTPGRSTTRILTQKEGKCP